MEVTVSVFLSGLLVLTCPTDDISQETQDCSDGQPIRVLIARAPDHRPMISWLGTESGQEALPQGAVLLSASRITANVESTGSKFVESLGLSSEVQRTRAPRGPDQDVNGLPDQSNDKDHRWAPLVRTLRTDRVVKYRPGCLADSVEPEQCENRHGYVDFPEGGRLETCVFASVRRGPVYDQLYVARFRSSDVGAVGSRAIAEVSRFRFLTEEDVTVTWHEAGEERTLRFSKQCEDGVSGCYEFNRTGNSYSLDLFLTNDHADPSDRRPDSGEPIEHVRHLYDLFQNLDVELPTSSPTNVLHQPDCAREYMGLEELLVARYRGKEALMVPVASPLCPHLSD